MSFSVIRVCKVRLGKIDMRFMEDRKEKDGKGFYSVFLGNGCTSSCHLTSVHDFDFESTEQHMEFSVRRVEG